jgi:ATP-dependent exoDNAse (exonuclease V) beta subunit
VRKFNPSAYGEEIDRAPTDEIHEQATLITAARSTADTPATLYGRWWHEFMQRIAWHEEASWKQTFDEHQITSPAPKRSKDEWGLLLQCLKNNPDFSEILSRTEVVAYQEMPFFWRMDERKCLEGIIDLAFFNQKANAVFILDWKTNRIPADKIDVLRELYRPQMAAYWQAVLELTNARVSAAVYSTATGQLVIYGDDELSEEWRRLSSNF